MGVSGVGGPGGVYYGEASDPKANVTSDLNQINQWTSQLNQDISNGDDDAIDDDIDQLQTLSSQLSKDYQSCKGLFSQDQQSKIEDVINNIQNQLSDQATLGKLGDTTGKIQEDIAETHLV